MARLDVFSICNALVDILIKVEDKDITNLGLTKGIMHLVDEKRQSEVLQQFSNHKTTTELGGSCLNAVRTLAHLGCATGFAGMVGENHFGRLIQQRMHELRIKPSLKQTKEQTGTCLILITPDGERTMNTNLGASRLFDRSLVPDEDVKNAEYFHFCGYQWDTPDQIATIEHAISLCKNHGVRVSFDVADPFVIGRHRDAFLELIDRHADVVFSNRDEAKMLYHCTPEEMALKVSTGTQKICVVKKGAEGAVVGFRGELIQVRPVSTTVVDTTAAGDMFAAGFLYGLARKKDLPQCGYIASQLASDVISRVGASVADAAIARVKS